MCFSNDTVEFYLLSMNFIRPFSPVFVTAEHLTQRSDAVALPEFLNYRGLFNESDIKRAVAFLRNTFQRVAKISCFTS